MSRHEYMLEHYLVNNAFKALFPFGSQSTNRALNVEAPRAIPTQYMLMTAYFAIIKTMLIGLARVRGAAFGPEDVIRGVQLCSKTSSTASRTPNEFSKFSQRTGSRPRQGWAS